ENLIVRCTLVDGQAGFGEGVPRDYVTGETLDSTWAHLKSANWASLLGDGDIDSFEVGMKQAERVSAALEGEDSRRCQTNAGRCAVELALLDAYARGSGGELSQVTKSFASGLFQFQPKVQYSGAITSADSFKLRLAALVMKLYGFAHLKV